MELPVWLQLRELGWALAVGAGMALLNGLLRPLRRGSGSTALADVLWCFDLLISLLGFTIYPGRGRLRAVALLAMTLSGGLWTAASAALRKLLKKRQKNCKNFAKKAKKVLHLSKNLLQ